jgi:hypothetical protein
MAAEAITGSGVEALAAGLQDALAAAYEEAAGHRAEAQAYREHAEADHAALQRIGAVLQRWCRMADSPGMTLLRSAALARAGQEIQEAIDGSQEGSHGRQEGNEAVSPATGRG